MPTLHECQALLSAGISCLGLAEFDCREHGPVCIRHSHPRSCCRNLWREHDLAAEADFYANAYGFACIPIVENPEAIGDPNQTPRVKFVTRAV